MSLILHVSSIPGIFPISAALSSIRSEFFTFFFNDPSTAEIYTLSLHDALPIGLPSTVAVTESIERFSTRPWLARIRSEEHTSELQSLRHLVCRLLLEKKNLASA